ncbi:MAG: adenosine kinase [Alphaproteobacteria bacterium]|nr:adenosine kinase [Alphaproteobacteria bacterium]
MSRPYEVTALGSAIVDVIASVEDEFLLDHGIAKGVMTLVDEHRAQVLETALPAPRHIAGGSAANTMAGLASLGARGAFLGKVRDDARGRAFATGMSSLGVHYPTPMARSGPATACCLIAVTPDGERSMNTFLGANLAFSMDDLDQGAIEAAEILYLEGYLWDAPSAKAACLRAMEVARGAGTRVAFALSDPFLAARYRQLFAEMIEQRRCDILFANEEEIKSLFEASRFDDVLQRIEAWGGIAALTRSEKGCVICGRGEVHVLDAEPVTRVVDTTGAGDQFAAGFLFGLVREKPLADCGRLGAIAAAEVISHLGARPEVSLRDLADKAGLL